MLVVVDLGNSALKFGAFEGERLIATERVEGGRDVATGVIPFSYFSVADEVAVAASAPDQVQHLLARAERPVRVLGDEVKRRVESTYARCEDLGIDRIAAAFGALELVGGAAVAVDVGTAITVDAIRADGTLVPVAIAPGLTTAARGLRETAPHLPRPDFGAALVAAPARATADSLRAGFLLGFAGLVDRLVGQACALLSRDAPVLLTGGEAARLAPLITTPHVVDAELVLRGIRALHLRFPA